MSSAMHFKVRLWRIGLLLLLILFSYGGLTMAAEADAPLKVFPGACGFGTETPAGRGGRIVIVTNLKDRGTGSLRDAVQSSGPRIIVFAVGGEIRLESDLTFASPFVTLAGQSAPFPGIQISGGRITIQTHDVLIQHLRARYGDYSGSNRSHALRVISGAYNVVVDHCTLMWADDEVASIWTRDQPIHDVTFSNNIIAEGWAGHGYGTAIGSQYQPPLGPNWVDRISLLKNLYANNAGRDPLVSRDARVEIINNLSYNAEYEFCLLGANNGPVAASVIGNHYLTGHGDRYRYAIEVQRGADGSRVFLRDNRVDGVSSRTLFRDLTGKTLVGSPPLASGYTPLPVADVRALVLRSAGAWPGRRDTVEKRLIAEVANASGRRKHSLAEVGGWPDDYARMTTTRAFDRFLPANPQGDDDQDGYSNIEEVLHQLAAEVERI